MTTTAAVGLAGQNALLRGSVSAAIVEMLDALRHSVVQVRVGQRGGGTGIIWRPDGAVLTNYHVVAQGGSDLQALFTDGRLLEARLFEADPSLDMALLEVSACDLPAARVGDSARLRVGELVFALGHPWGERWVATVGVVSGLGALHLPGHRSSISFIRSDVRLAPGNSGGPLLNARGEVVGINAMVFGGDLGVAIASRVVSEWARDATSRRARLGVEV